MSLTVTENLNHKIPSNAKFGQVSRELQRFQCCETPSLPSFFILLIQIEKGNLGSAEEKKPAH